MVKYGVKDMETGEIIFQSDDSNIAFIFVELYEKLYNKLKKDLDKSNLEVNGK